MNTAVNKNEYQLLSEKLKDSVDQCLHKAEQHYLHAFKYQFLEINIKGRAAGQIKYSYTSKSSWNTLAKKNLPILRFNPYLLMTYKEKFIQQVVPHECAHLVAYALYGLKIKPHGPEWKAIMVDLYEQRPDVTHQFEIPKKNKPLFSYKCLCKELQHQLSIIRHNKVVKEKAIYLCKKCRSPLIYNH